MATGKRASMREGPLAELFRKTEQAGEDAAAAKADAPKAPEAPAPAPPAPPVAERRESAPPHPGLAPQTAAAEEAEHRVPTPQERLRHAFSSDIPEDILERPGTPRRELDFDSYSPSASRSSGTPVIRVVGVGGAGVEHAGFQPREHEQLFGERGHAILPECISIG